MATFIKAKILTIEAVELSCIYSRNTCQASKHESSISIFMLVAVDVSSMLQQQTTHICLALIGCVHQRSHAILSRSSKETTVHEKLVYMYFMGQQGIYSKQH